MSSLATNFIPVPLHERIGANSVQTDKNTLNEKDFSFIPAFREFFEQNRSEIEKVYLENPLLAENFSVKEFALELMGEME